MEPIRTSRAMVAGAVAALVGLSVTATIAALHGGARSPFDSLGDRVMVGSPSWLQRWAIETFGSGNRTVLVGSMVAVVVLVGLVAGLSGRRSSIGVWWVVVPMAALGVGAVVIDPLAEVVPSVVAVLAGAATTGFVCMGLLRSGAEDEDRRRFLLAAGGAAGFAVVVGLVGRSFADRVVASLDRSEVVVPEPADPADPVPAGLAAAVTPLIVPVEDFFRIDTALNPPAVPIDGWSLAVTGMVERPFTLTYGELLARPMVERHITIACVSNPVGGPYVGTATWTGVPLAELLDMAGPLPGADQLVGRSVDGWTAGFPTELARDGRDALVAVAMNGEPLPQRHGFPARLVVPGLFGYVSATKWLEEIELTTWDGFDGFWVPRGWSKEGPMKTQSRIDRPANHATIEGPVVVAGVAWATHRGIEAVEVRLNDEGDWIPTELSPSLGIDVWRQWSVTLDLPPGQHLLRVRATDGTGAAQPSEPKAVDPDGAEGHHTVRFVVA